MQAVNQTGDTRKPFSKTGNINCKLLHISWRATEFYNMHAMRLTLGNTAQYCRIFSSLWVCSSCHTSGCRRLYDLSASCTPLAEPAHLEETKTFRFILIISTVVPFKAVACHSSKINNMGVFSATPPNSFWQFWTSVFAATILYAANVKQYDRGVMSVNCVVWLALYFTKNNGHWISTSSTKSWAARPGSVVPGEASLKIPVQRRVEAVVDPWVLLPH